VDIAHCFPAAAGECACPPAQRKRRANAFATTRGDKTAMPPFAKLLERLFLPWVWKIVVSEVLVDNRRSEPSPPLFGAPVWDYPVGISVGSLAQEN